MPTETAASDTDRASPGAFEPGSLRGDFPILSRTVNGHPLVYLDNAATTQKPKQVIDAVSRFYETTNANIHRGVHTLSVEATRAYEAARRNVQRFVGASRPEEIVFVRGTTEAINLVAQTAGRSKLGSGDEVLISHMEHHSNSVPWQIVCEQTGAMLKVAPINDRWELEVEAFEEMLNERTRIVSLVHVSNALGTVNPVAELTRLARQVGALVLIDGAQASAHGPIDVRAIGCDFYTLSGHKMLSPTGIGALFGRYELLDALPPYQGGGDMIKHVRLDRTVYNDVPHKFEAGTPNVGGAIGMAAAIDYLRDVGLNRIERAEHGLVEEASLALAELPGVRLIGTAAQKASVVSFVVEGIHAHDIGTVLDQFGVAVRTGHHCAQPVMDRFGVESTTRASFALYNTHDEVAKLLEAVSEAIRILG